MFLLIDMRRHSTVWPVLFPRGRILNKTGEENTCICSLSDLYCGLDSLSLCHDVSKIMENKSLIWNCKPNKPVLILCTLHHNNRNARKRQYSTHQANDDLAVTWLKKDTSNCEQSRETKYSEYLNLEFRVTSIFFEEKFSDLIC